MTYIIIFFIVIAIVLYNWYLHHKENKHREESSAGNDYLYSKEILAFFNTKTGFYHRDEYLIRDFILGIHKTSKLDKRPLFYGGKGLIAKPEYIEIWGDEDESKLISIIRNIEKDSNKLGFRQMLSAIYYEPYIRSYTSRITNGAKKILEKGIIESHLSRHPISPRFFSCPDDKFLEIINSGKTFLEENEITKPEKQESPNKDEEIKEKDTEREFKSYYDNGKLKVEGSFLDGKAIGVWKYYIYFNDEMYIRKMSGEEYEKLKEEGKLDDIDGLIEEIKNELSLNQMKDGKREGEWRKYYDNGKLAYEGYFKDDNRDGYWKIYNEDGQLMMEGNFKNGVEEGLWKFYNEDGTLKEEKTYKDGEEITKP